MANRYTQTFVADVQLNGKNAINNIDLIEKEIKKLKQEARDMKLGGKEGSEEYKETMNAVKDLEKEVKRAKSEVLDLSKSFSTAGKSVAGLKNELKIATQQYNRLTNEADRNKMALRIRQIKTALQEMNGQLDVANTKSSAFGRLAQRAAEYTGMYMLINRSRQIVTNAIQGNLALSDSISDIQKVSGLSEEAVKGLVGEIEKLDSRNAPEVLNNMAYAAGKLGIKGAENLLGFTRAADKLNVALKEYLGDGADGVVSLMKFANVMGTTEKYGVEQALIKTGSALNYMTQSTAAAADYMIEFASRFGPIARQARMTSGDVIGLASALDALAVNNEEAATSLQKFVIKVLSSPVHVSKALGMDADAAKEMVETGKSIELVEMALAKLGERAEKYGVSGITSVIGDIGSKGQAQRLIKTLATLANNTQMVGDYVTMANKAFTEGTSVLDEYNIKNQNAAAIMERAKNIWSKFLVNSQEVGVVKELAQEFYDMSVALQDSTTWMGSMTGSMKLLMGVLKMLISILPQLITYLTFTGIARGAIAVINLAKSFMTLRTAFMAMNATMQASVMGAIATAFVLIAQACGMFSDELVDMTIKEKEATKQNDRFKESLNKAQSEIVAETRELDKLFGALQATNNTQTERIRLINLINSKYGSYLSHMLTEKSSAADVAAAYDEINKKLRENIYYKAKLGMIENVEKSRGEDLVSNMADLKERLEVVFQKAKVVSSPGTVDDKLIQTAVQQVSNALSQKLMEGGNAGKDMKEFRSELEDLVYNESLKYFNPVTLGTIGLDNSLGVNDKVRESLGNLSFVVVKRDEELKTAEDLYSPFLQGFIPPSGAGYDATTETLEDFSKEQREAEMEKKRMEALMRKELDQEYKGLKALIEAFYNERAASINKLHEDGKIVTAMERDQWLEANDVMKAEAINNAWKYLLGDEGGKELWDAQYQQMYGQILTDTEDLGAALQLAWTYIGQNNMTHLAELLKNFGSKLTGEMRNTIAKNDKLIAESGSKVWEEFEKTLDKHDYEEVVRKKFWGLLNQLHLFRTQYEDGMTEGFDNATDAALAGIDELAGKYDMLFAINIKTAEGMEQFKQMLSSTSVTSHQMAQMADADLERLYYVMVTLGEEMSNANKKWVEFQKKRVLEPMYKRTDTYYQDNRATGKQEQVNKSVATGMGKFGLQSNAETQDNEIQLYALKLQAATDYFNYLVAMNADEMILEEQRQKMMEATIALQDKMAAKMSVMQEWFKDAMNTLPDYGTALGEAFAKTDPEERAEAFQEAHKAILKDLGETTKKMILEWVKQRIQHALQQKLMVSDTKKGEEEQFSITTTAETALSNAVTSIGQTTLVNKQKQSSESAATDMQDVQRKVGAGIVGGGAKTIEELGWWGIPLIAVISAVLNGLLSWFMGSLSKNKNTKTETPKTLRLASGMLVYDEGNVSETLNRFKVQGSRFRGTDGRTYKATATPTPEGTALVRHPIATMIGGQPALVGERGTELIIGRRTLRDMSQFRPDLLQQLYAFEKRRFRTYDEGNVGDVGSRFNVQGSSQDPQMQQTLQSLQQTVAMLSSTMEALQRNGIYAKINKYGAGGLVDEVADGLYTTKKRGNNTNVRRLFG